MGLVLAGIRYLRASNQTSESEIVRTLMCGNVALLYELVSFFVQTKMRDRFKLPTWALTSYIQCSPRSIQ